LSPELPPRKDCIQKPLKETSSSSGRIFHSNQLHAFSPKTAASSSTEVTLEVENMEENENGDRDSKKGLNIGLIDEVRKDERIDYPDSKLNKLLSFQPWEVLSGRWRVYQEAPS
ncbi:hypothetical protein CEXT_409731, partial [Caerostris extrusa]